MCPERHRCVADPQVLARAPSQQRIQGRAVGESGSFRDGRVLALFLAMRALGVIVERYERCAGSLRAHHTLDPGMKPRQRPGAPCNETWSLAILFLLKQGGRFRQLVQARARTEPKDDILINGD